MENLYRRFVECIGASVLDELGCSLETTKNDRNPWLANAIRTPHRAHAPIRHVLILRFLQIDIQTLAAPFNPSVPFGNGPWPCLNHASDHYGVMKIEDIAVKVTREGRSVRGVFQCLECGMVSVADPIRPTWTDGGAIEHPRTALCGRSCLEAYGAIAPCL